MKNFNFSPPTKIIFGKDTENKIGDKLMAFGANSVLLHYYNDSIIKDMA